MTSSEQDKKFNDTLKRMMAQEPKPQEEMKRGKSRNENPNKPDKDRGS